jgi:hypothetical protein
LHDLCLLYGINSVLQVNNGIIEGGFAKPSHFESLNQLKYILLDKLRHEIVSLTDGIGFPDHVLKSALAFGNPYQVNDIINTEFLGSCT